MMRVLCILAFLCFQRPVSSRSKVANEELAENDESLTNANATGLNYTLTVYTGDGYSDGTTNLISVVLHGTLRASELIGLNGIMTSLRRGSVHQFAVNVKAPLGDLIMIEVRSTLLLFIDNKWFLNKIVVRTSADEELLFPFYRWVHDGEPQFLRPATALLESQDVHPIGKKQRKKELTDACHKYRWSPHQRGAPATVAAETTFDLSIDVQYDVQMAEDFRNVFWHVNKDKKHMIDSMEQWDSEFTGLGDLMSWARSQTYEYVKEHWDEDQFFGYQFLNGLNPMMIQRCSKLPENFPVTEEMVRDSMGGSTLKQEMKNGNIFLVDYKILDGLVGNVVHDRQTYIVAPLVLLYSNPEGHMMPIAIQLTQEMSVSKGCGDEEARPLIFLPTDSKYDWLLAKVFARAADTITHQMVYHMLRTHFLAEVFVMATLRNLPSTHPLYKLLIPHARYTLHIDVVSRSLLDETHGLLGQYSGIASRSLTELLKRATASLTYGSLCLPCNIGRRGLETVPNYYYRDDGFRLWNIIHKFVDGVLTHYYTSNEAVSDDSELQHWISEIFTKGFMGRNQTGMPQSFTTQAELVKFVTLVIFTSTAQHAAVHNRQFDLGGWMPNFPFVLRRPPPTDKGWATMASVLETLPDRAATAHFVAGLKIITEEYSDLRPLGYFPEELFGEEEPRRLIKALQADLKVLSSAIDKRNDQLELPYTPLHPSNIVNSISI